MSEVRVDNALVDAVQKDTGSAPKRRYRISAAKVKDRQNCVGWLMAKLLGFKIAGTSFPSIKPEPYYEEFKQRLINYHMNRRFNADEEANHDAEIRFKDDYKELLRHALSCTDVLVFTTTQALDPAYREGFAAELVVIDEASQINDSEFASLQSAYKNADKFVLAGDCKQLGVFHKDRADNPVLPQWRKSIHQRFRDVGFTTATFFEQHRCSYDIAELVSKIYYHGDIKAKAGSQDRPFSKKVRNFNQRHFDIRKNVVFIDVPDTRPGQVDTSWCCKETADVVVDLVEKFGEDEAENIFTLTPYKEQMLEHGRRIEKLAARKPKYWKVVDEELKVTCQTFMGIQGAENKISIMDLTIGERIGFLKDNGQTLVGCSRGSDALYIVGDVSMLKRMANYDTHAIGRLVQYCEDEGLIWKRPAQLRACALEIDGI